MQELVPIGNLDVDQLEEAMLWYKQANCPVTHTFGPGVYVREVTFPADTYAIGHYQNFEHINIMIKGKVRMINEDGTSTILTAPLTFIGKPGRKMGYIIEETIWQNVYATAEQDIEKFEAKYVTKSAASEQHRLLEKQERLSAQLDYKTLLLELKITEQQVKAEVEDLSDHSELPYGTYKFQIGDSDIEGKGIFATGDIRAEECIGPARLDNKRTVLGRRVNHSNFPNAIMVPRGNDLYLYAITDIAGRTGSSLGDEITTDYRFTIQKRMEMKL